MIFDLTANTNRRKLMVLDPSYPKDVSTTVIKGNTTSATFSVVITEPGSPDEYTYQWYVNGSAVSGANSASYTRTGLSATATYSVYCEVTNKAGTVKSRVATLKVTQYYTPTLNSSYPANASVVKGNSITSKVVISTAGNPASYTYQWYKNGTKVSGATSASYTFTPTAVGTTTLYCKVTNTAGTVTSRTATITATNLYLYKAGNTSGWTKKAHTWKGDSLSDGTATINYGTNSMTITGPSGAIGGTTVYHDTAIDLTNFNTLTLDGYFAGTMKKLCVWSSFGTYVEDNLAAYIPGYESDVNVPETRTIDVSGLSGKHYIGFALKQSAYPVVVESLMLS